MTPEQIKSLNEYVTNLKKYYDNKSVPPPEDMQNIFNILKLTIDKVCFIKARKNKIYLLNDYKQVCYLAVYDAIKNFDQSKMNFNKYVVYWMIAYIKEESKRNNSLFKYGSRMDRKIFGKISNMSHMTLEEQAEKLEVSAEDLSSFLNSTKFPDSIVKSKSEDSEGEEEWISANANDPEKLYEMKDVYEKIKSVIDDFKKSLTTEREQDVLLLLEKLGNPEKGNFKESELDEYPNSYSDIAEKHGVSRERVRQISLSLKEKLRFKFIKNGIDEKTVQIFM